MGRYVEQLAEKVHDAWWEVKKEGGFHAPNDCPHDQKCEKCHGDMIPYNDLADEIKEYDRVTVRCVLAAQEAIRKEYTDE